MGLEPLLPEPQFDTRGGSPINAPFSLLLSISQAAESMAHAQPNLLASGARLRRPLTGNFKREAKLHWSACAFLPYQHVRLRADRGLAAGSGRNRRVGRGDQGLDYGEKNPDAAAFSGRAAAASAKP